MPGEISISSPFCSLKNQGKMRIQTFLTTFRMLSLESTPAQLGTCLYHQQEAGPSPPNSECRPTHSYFDAKNNLLLISQRGTPCRLYSTTCSPPAFLGSLPLASTCSAVASRVEGSPTAGGPLIALGHSTVNGAKVREQPLFRPLPQFC